jgi:NAD-dependent SIR2 family protein deacetylase
MKLIQRASVKELALKMKDNGSPPRFAFFLGAGASLQSGIITAGETIQGFKESILTACCPIEIKTNIEKDKWLQNQAWYRKNTNEYSTLFEKFEAKEIGRQRYIERMIEGKEPSFGYLVLANLMASNLINTIVTTNFDDLIFKACARVTSAFVRLFTPMALVLPSYGFQGHGIKS